MAETDGLRLDVCVHFVDLSCLFQFVLREFIGLSVGS